MKLFSPVESPEYNIYYRFDGDSKASAAPADLKKPNATAVKFFEHCYEMSR
jgi:hypothetical protein